MGRIEQIANEEIEREQGRRFASTTGEVSKSVLIPEITFKSAGELLDKPAPTEWLVRNILERGCLYTLIGAPSSFKSGIAIDIAASVACGIAWHGNATRQGAVFYIAGEGHPGIKRRLKAWQIVKGDQLAPAPLYVSTGAASLIEPLNAASVSTVVQRIADRCKAKPEFVVIDTLARNFGAADENSAADMSRFITNIDTHIRQYFDCSVMIVHHSGVVDTSRARGSSSLKAAVDTEIIAERTDRTVTLRCTKNKDAAEFEPMTFESRIVELPWLDEDGKPVKSFVLHKIQLDHIAEKMTGLGKNQRRALDILGELYIKARCNLTDAGHSPDGALISLSEWQTATRLERNRFSETVAALRARQLIDVEVPHVRIR